MNSQEIQLEIYDESKPLNSEDKKKDIKKQNISKERKIPFYSRLFFLWTLDMMRLSNKGQLKKDVIRIKQKQVLKFENDFYCNG